MNTASATHTRRSVAVIPALLLASLLFCPCVEAQDYRLIDLSTLGGSESSAMAINEKYSVAGWSYTNGLSGMRGFLWRPGMGMTNLGILSGDSAASDVNNADAVVGRSGDSAFLWTHGVMINLGVPTPAGAGAINDASQIAGAYGTSPYPDAFLWTNGIFVPLLSTAGAADWASDINNRGNIAGTFHAGNRSVGIWFASGERAVIANNAESGRMNNFDWVTGHVGPFAFVGSTTNVIHIGTGVPGDFALDVNDLGQVVGQLNFSGKQGLRAFLWNDDNKNNAAEPEEIHDLNDLIAPSSEWVLPAAHSINNTSAIVGEGLYQGQRRAFLLSRSPVIVTHPAHQSVIPNGNAHFHVTVIGVEPLSYQWLFNGTNLLASQTNSTLTLSNIQLTGVGTYSVAVSNIAGIVVSSNALLTIVLLGVDDDGDGLANELEIQFGTNPLSPNTDTDTLTDYDELFVYGTNPLLADTDGDGIPDGWELAHGLNPRFNDASEDLDGDGVANRLEFQHGTNPRSATTGSTNDFQGIFGERNARYTYDRNDRLVGAEYANGLAIAYGYDGSGNIVRQTHLKQDTNSFLPGLWRFLNGLTNAAQSDPFADSDGDGWSNYQEWKAGSNPTNHVSTPSLLGNPGTNIASLAWPFTPSNFVVAVGQLDGLGAEEIVIGADGNPGTNTNFLLVLTRTSSTWSTQRVDIGPFGVTSLAIGQPTNRPVPAIYVGLRGTTDGSGRIMEFASNGGIWQSNLVALSTNHTAFVLGVRGPDLLVSVAETNLPEGSLSAVNFTTNWGVSLLDTNTFHRGLGTLFQSQQQAGSIHPLRLLDYGGIAVGTLQSSGFTNNLVSYWKLDESSGNASDSAGTNTLININAVAYSPGKINNGADFGVDNTTKHFTTSSLLGLTGAFSDRTYSMWWKAKAIQDGREMILFDHSYAATKRELLIKYYRNGSTYTLNYSDQGSGAGGGNVFKIGELAGDTWCHLVWVRTNGVLYGYYNGTEVSHTALNDDVTGASVTTDGFTVGTLLRSTTVAANGLVDEFGLWSRALSAGEVKQLFGNGYGTALFSSFLLPEPIATRTNNWRGTSLTTGFVRFGVGSSVFYTFADDKNTNGQIDFGDDFVVAEYVTGGTNRSPSTLSRRSIAEFNVAQSYGLASVNFLNSSNEVFFTGEPDGQVFAWTATGSTNPLQRQLFSAQYAGKAWHAMAGVKTLEPGEGLVGLLVDPAAPSNCNLIVWPPQPQLPQSVTFPQTAPLARVLPEPNFGGAFSKVSVRSWDAEGNPAALYLQYQVVGTSNWVDATVAMVNENPNVLLPVPALPGGSSNSLIWNAAHDLGSGITTNVFLRVRGRDITLLGDWSEPSSYTITGCTDCDGDGLPDAWEFAVFGNMTQTGSGDFDQDGFNNVSEYLAGTNPNDPTSSLRITLIRKLPGGLAIDWRGGTSGLPVLQHSFTLQTTNWFDLRTNTTPGLQTGTFSNLPHASQLEGFRLRLER